jgi:hypothetical protein
MDGTFAGDGPGPRCMIPKIKNVLLASADQVALDAAAARLMGFDPLGDVKFIRLAHERGLGCGDTQKIEFVGDVDAARENWGFEGPFKKMTFAATMQHKIYWGRMRRFVEWSLKTWLAPWAYIASVLYHDSFWYPIRGRVRVQQAMSSAWGRLFHNWETTHSDGRGYPEIAESKGSVVRSTWGLLGLSLDILKTCIREAPEIASRRRRTVKPTGS